MRWKEGDRIGWVDSRNEVVWMRIRGAGSPWMQHLQPPWMWLGEVCASGGSVTRRRGSHGSAWGGRGG